jgi:hypothetical protein
MSRLARLSWLLATGYLVACGLNPQPDQPSADGGGGASAGRGGSNVDGPSTAGNKAAGDAGEPSSEPLGGSGNVSAGGEGAGGESSPGGSPGAGGEDNAGGQQSAGGMEGEAGGAGVSSVGVGGHD